MAIFLPANLRPVESEMKTAHGATGARGGFALLLTVVAINLVADQLRDVLNPRLQSQ